MSKVVYIIPGFGERTSLKGYQEVIKAFKSSGFKTIPIKISWKRKVMKDYVEECISQLKHSKNDDVYLFGFSLGAMIALITANKIKPKKLILASLSPYFKEDLKYIKASWKKIIGKKRMNNFKNFSFNELANKITCKTILIAGDKEHKILFRRINDSHKKMKNSKIIIAKGAEHNINKKEYFNIIKETIKNI